MSYKEKLVPGLTVELRVPEGDFKGSYKTHVDEVGERILSVYAPMANGQIIPFHEKLPLEVTFCDEITAYSFDSSVIQRIAVPIPIFVLDFPEQIRRVQRRAYVRVPAFYELSYRIITREGLSELHTGNMLDLSGGGLRFLTKEKLENNSLIHAVLHLPKGEIQTPAKICRVEKHQDSKKYNVSASFYQISEKDRERIIRLVFELQRAMRQKGLF